MRKSEYYELMQNFEELGINYKKVKEAWYNCFGYILKSFKAGHNTNTIDSLFYDFAMINWTAMHLENTEFCECNKKQLFKYFCSECFYVCDRSSYDRLFRTHWLFLQAFKNEISSDRLKRFYEDDSIS